MYRNVDMNSSLLVMEVGVLAVLGSSLCMDDTSHRSSFSIFDGGSILLVAVKGALLCRFAAGGVARTV